MLTGLKDLTVDGVADGLAGTDGGWYLSAVMLFVTFWAVRGRIKSIEAGTKRQEEATAKQEAATKALHAEHTAAVDALFKAHTKTIDDLNERHYAQQKEQTLSLMKYMSERDAEVKELLAEATATQSEVASAVSIVAGDLRSVQAEIRHKLTAKTGV